MKLNAVTVLGILIHTGLVASAQELKPLTFGRRVQPRAFAWTDGSGRMITPWKQIDGGGGSPDGCASDLLLYDNFEAADLTGIPTDDCYDYDCGFLDPTARWFFGTKPDENQRQFVIDDMVVAPGTEGVPASRIQLAFFLGPCEGAGFSQVFIGLTTYDDVSTDCLGLDCDGNGEPDCAADHPLLNRGLVFDITDVPCGGLEAGYTILDFDLCDNGEPPLPMPPDGAGGYSVTLARDYNPDTGEFILAHAAQMMLWGNTLLKTGNPSHQEITYWVDANGDQQISILDECASAFFPEQCPNALGTMVAFWGTRGQAGFEPCSGEFVPGDCEPCDMNCDGEINAFDIEPFLELLFGQNPDPCDTCTGDANGDGVVNAFDIEPFLACLFP